MGAEFKYVNRNESSIHYVKSPNCAVQASKLESHAN